MNDTAPAPSTKILGRTFSEWFATLPVFLLLILTLALGTSEMMHGQLLRFGEVLFGKPEAQVQYFMLRSDPVAPDCTLLQDVEGEVQKRLSGGAASGQTSVDQDIDDLFSDAVAISPDDMRKSITQANAICQGKLEGYQKILGYQTTQLKVYRAIEMSFFKLFEWGSANRSMILLLIIAITGITATWSRHHISIRPPIYTKDHRLSSILMTAAAAFLLMSFVSYYRILVDTNATIEKPIVHYLWWALFAAIFAINLVRIFKPAPNEAGPGTWALAGLSVPLFAHMGVIAGVYFLATNHPAGMAIYINQLIELPNIFLNLGLFILSGMLLKQSRVVDMFLELVRPWKFSPQMLTYIILLAAAVPTAYTGASGIFVIAAGGIIYHEIRVAGGTRQFALAATAMSGSLGVVLRPCLLVVLIAALNRSVTTNGLFHYGVYVFLLTSTLFFIASQIVRTQKIDIAPVGKAFPAMLRQMPALMPYVALVVALVVFYKYALNTPLNEISAPIIMPILMLLVLIFDKFLNRHKPDVTADHSSHRQKGIEPAIRYAASETMGHIGALVTLMTLSLAVGGVIERSELMLMAPQVFPNEWATMAFLTLILVFVGMMMDPFGAVILVTGTLAPVAYANHIDPLHFWMVVLVAFELGYLSPPVALNQLLTRQVIGEEEVNLADQEVKNAGFYRRYERWILPAAVMLVGLILVGFGPLIVKASPLLQSVVSWLPAVPTQ